MRGETYCPTCGQERLIPRPGGINEYDPRHELLPRHKTPGGAECRQTTTPKDAIVFLEEWRKAGIVVEPAIFPLVKVK